MNVAALKSRLGDLTDQLDDRDATIARLTRERDDAVGALEYSQSAIRDYCDGENAMKDERDAALAQVAALVSLMVEARDWLPMQTDVEDPDDSADLADFKRRQFIALRDPAEASAAFVAKVRATALEDGRRGGLEAAAAWVDDCLRQGFTLTAVEVSSNLRALARDEPDEASGTFACPVCGIDTPHGLELLQQDLARMLAEVKREESIHEERCRICGKANDYLSLLKEKVTSLASAIEKHSLARR